jgi:hypothetical protein
MIAISCAALVRSDILIRLPLPLIKADIRNETIAKGDRSTLCPITYKKISYGSTALLRALCVRVTPPGRSSHPEFKFDPLGSFFFQKRNERQENIFDYD